MTTRESRPARIALLTGATGVLGVRLLEQLLCSQSFETIYCAVRPRGGQSPRARLLAHAATYGFELPEHVRALSCDLRHSQLGMAAADYQVLRRDVTHIFHCAADVRFHLPMETLREINVEGTRHVLELARHCHAENPAFSHLAHVSTAYVASHRLGLVGPDVLDARYGFRNAYEQSKHEAELLVRSERARVPSTIFRPSIVWSLDARGHMPAGSATYPLIRLIQKWPFPIIPVWPNRLDIVSDSFVATAIKELSLGEAPFGKAYHLTAGVGAEVSLHEFYELLEQAFATVGEPRRLRPAPMWKCQLYIALAQLTGHKKLRSRAAWESYLPYARTPNARFDNSSTRTALAGRLEPCTGRELLQASMAEALRGILQRTTPGPRTRREPNIVTAYE